MKKKSLIVFIFLLFLVSCSKPYDKKANIEFVKDNCGKIILTFKENLGSFPTEFENTTVTYISNSGEKRYFPLFRDKYGYPVNYVWTGNNSFYFVFVGANGKDDNGQMDDYKLVYDNGWQD
jgi:hypothetical protein